MSFLNAPIPPVKVQVRKEFVTGGKENGLVPALWIGVSSRLGFSLGCHVLMDTGAMYIHLPIHALLMHPLTSEQHEHEHLEYWDQQACDISISTFPILGRCCARLRGGKESPGGYLFTVDASAVSHPDFGMSKIPDEHKWKHIIQLDNGQIAALPNNAIRWLDTAWVTKPLERLSVQEQHWSVENDWKSEDSDSFFYKVEKR